MKPVLSALSTLVLTIALAGSAVAQSQPPAQAAEKAAAEPSPAGDPFVTGAPATPKASVEVIEQPTANCQVLLETFDLSRADLLTLLDEKGGDTAQYRMIEEWMNSNRAKLIGVTAHTQRSGERVNVQSVQELRYPVEFAPSGEPGQAVASLSSSTRKIGETVEMELVAPRGGSLQFFLNVNLVSARFQGFQDFLTVPSQPASAVPIAIFVQRTLTTSVKLSPEGLRFLGTFSGVAEDAAPSATMRVAFAHVWLVPNVAPEGKPVRHPGALRFEYSFFSLERAAARTLLLANPDSQKCYDSLRQLTRDGRARLEHLQVTAVNSGNFTATAESLEVPQMDRKVKQLTFPARSAGFSMQMEPTLNEAGTVVDVNIVPRFVRHLGLLELTGAAKKFAAEPLLETRDYNGAVFATIGRQQFLSTFNHPGDTGANGSKDDGRVTLGFVRAVPAE